MELLFRYFHNYSLVYGNVADVVGRAVSSRMRKRRFEKKEVFFFETVILVVNGVLYTSHFLMI